MNYFSLLFNFILLNWLNVCYLNWCGSTQYTNKLNVLVL